MKLFDARSYLTLVCAATTSVEGWARHAGRRNEPEHIVSGRRGHGRARGWSRLIPAAGTLLMLCAGPAARAQPDAQQDHEDSRAADVAVGAFDLLVLRPASVVALAVGAAFFVVSAPLVAPEGNFSETRYLFLEVPFEYAFQRRLGDF